MAERDDDQYKMFAAVAAFICIFGSVSNGLTLATFIRHRSLWTTTNTIICSMCFADFISSSVATPLIVHANISARWPFGEAGCKAYAFITTLCGLASINHLAGAAFERYDSLERVPKGRGILNRRRAAFGLLMLLWIYSLVFSVAPLANWSSYTTEGIGTSCSVDWSSSSPNAVSYTVVLYLGCFVLPLGIIGFSYYKLFRVVQRMRINAYTTWGRSSNAAAEALKTEKKMAFLILLMIAAFLISWTPYAVVSLISATGHKNIIGLLGESIPSYLAKSSCIYNPIIYALLFKPFRKNVFKLLPSSCCKCLVSGNRVRSGPVSTVYNPKTDVPRELEPFSNAIAAVALRFSPGATTQLTSESLRGKFRVLDTDNIILE